MELMKFFKKIAAIVLALSATLSAQSDRDQRLLELPAFSAPRIVTTLNEGGKFNFKDNFGDGQIGIVIIGDQKYYMLICRMSMWPELHAGTIFLKLYDGNPYEGWNKSNLKNPVRSIPGFLHSPSEFNIDTHVWAQNPLTLVVTTIHGTKPGVALPGTGVIFALQRATSATPGIAPSNWTMYPQEILLSPHKLALWEQPGQKFGKLWGGIAESSLVIDTFHQPPEALLFYVAKTTEGPDPFGQRVRHRLGRAVILLHLLDVNPKFIRDPAPGPNSYVFAPDETPGYGSTNKTAIWGTANTVLQPHVSINPRDGVMWMVAHGKKPNTRGGVTNRSDGLGLWHSLDRGKTWIAGKNNPIVTLATINGNPKLGANRLNSPHLLWDWVAMKVYLIFWGNPDGQQNQPGTNLYIMEADLS